MQPSKSKRGGVVLAVVVVFGVLGILGALALPARAASAMTGEERFKQALTAFEARDFARSAALLEKLAGESPGSALYWFNLGNARYMGGDLAGAAEAYHKVGQLGSGLAPAAALYEARCLRKLGRVDDAREALRALDPVKLPKNLAALLAEEAAAADGGDPFERGLALYKSGDYESAARAFDRALGTSPGADVYMMRGMANYRLGRSEPARADFGEVLRLSQDSELREGAEEFLGLLAGEEKERPYWAFADLGGGYSSNVFADGDSSTATAKPALQGFLGAGVAPFSRDGFSARLAYSLSWDEAFGVSSIRFITHYGYVPLGYAAAGWTFQLTPGYQLQTLGGSSFLSRPGARASVQRALGSHEVGFAYEGYVNTPGASQFNYLRGSSQSRRLYWGYTGTSFYASLAYVDAVEHSGNLSINGGVEPLTYNGRGPAVTLSVFHADDWEVSENASYLLKSYPDKAYTTSQPAGVERSDKLLDSTTKVQYRLRPGLRAYVSVEVIRNSSTLDAATVADKNYKQLISVGGLSWDIL